MQTVFEFPEWAWETLKIGLAGAAGSYVRNFHAKEKRWSRIAGDILAGALSAIYLSPIVFYFILPWTDAATLPQDEIRAVGGFLTGFMGILAFEAILSRIEKVSKRAKDPE